MTLAAPPLDLRKLPRPLGVRLRIKDVLLRAAPVRFDGTDPVHRYLVRRGIEIDPARLVPNVLFAHPLLAYWAGRSGTWPAMILLAGGPAIDCTFLTAAGELAPVTHTRLRLGALGAAARLADAAGAADLALLAQSTEGALRALASGFPGQIYCAVTLDNMRRTRLPPVRALRLSFEPHAPAGKRAEIIDHWRFGGQEVSEWTP